MTRPHVVDMDHAVWATKRKVCPLAKFVLSDI